jgi:hypothetical protein
MKKEAIMLVIKWLTATLLAAGLAVTPVAAAQAEDVPRGNHYGTWQDPTRIDVRVPARLGPGWRLGKAMKAWNASGVVNLQRNSKTTEAEVIVTLHAPEEYPSIRWAGLAWVVAWEGGSVDGHIAGPVDIWLNYEVTDRDERLRVMMHELGHALGLDHSTRVGDSVMNGAPTVTTTDIMELQELYTVGAEAASQTGTRR